MSPDHGVPLTAAAARDRALVERARAGDTGAFEELYGLHRERIMALALRFTGHRDDASDVVQEAFAYLVRKLPELDLTAQLSTFLYPVVKHLAADARRRAGRHSSEEAALDATIADAQGAPAQDDPRAHLAAALRALPEPQREALLLRFADGLSVEDAAAALGVPPGTVKSRVHHALRALRADERTRGYFEDQP